jgi:hypothetical protein
MNYNTYIFLNISTKNGMVYLTTDVFLGLDDVRLGKSPIFSFPTSPLSSSSLSLAGPTKVLDPFLPCSTNSLAILLSPSFIPSPFFWPSLAHPLRMLSFRALLIVVIMPTSTA